MFQVPSTPDPIRRSDNDTTIPSTTPAGPPPTSYTHHSFTPTGAPPAPSFLVSSYGVGDNAKPAAPFSFSTFLNTTSNAAPTTFDPREFDSFAEPGNAFGSIKHTSNDNLNHDDLFGDNFFKNTQAVPITFQPGDVNNTLYNSPKISKRMNNNNEPLSTLRASRMGPSQDINRDLSMPFVADALAAGLSSTTTLKETDEQITQTEMILVLLDEASKTKSEEELDITLHQCIQRLNREWAQYTNSESIPASIGPVDKSGFAKAFYAASLLFQIHNPVLLAHESTNEAHDNSLVQRVVACSHPRGLLDWLQIHHNPFPEDLVEVQNAKPSSTSHERFWDTVFQTLLRGNIATVISLLSKADWSHADTAVEDGYAAPGYTGAQLQAVEHVVSLCISLLETCPGLTNVDNDWNVTGYLWDAFRSRVRRALDDLETYAESSNADRGYGDMNVFAAMGKSSFAAGSRRAESKVPWTIYEQLKAVYGQLLGYREEILLSAQDWLEAVIYLSVWWDGEKENSNRKSQVNRQKERLVDIDPVAAYRERLLYAFGCVTDEPEDAVLGVNTVDAVQVALGCNLEGDVEGALKLIQKWSPLVAAAVVDIASIAGWMPQNDTRHDEVMDGFDANDLMVLGHGQMDKKATINRDNILVDFASLLAKQKQLTSTQTGRTRPGWEMAVRVLSRLDSTNLAQKQISGIFESITFTNTNDVDRALAVCDELSLTKQVRSISEHYANTLATNTHSYGQALLYYARAHSATQLQSTLDLLISTSLVHSAVFPKEEELDDQLADLLENRTASLARLARNDHEAAKLLATKLSGYATLRRYYNLRDEQVDNDMIIDNDDSVHSDGESRHRKSGLRPLARRKEMARSLIALISSASESIKGGLYDANAGSVLQIDTLLALLAEALPMMNGNYFPIPPFFSSILTMFLRS